MVRSIDNSVARVIGALQDRGTLHNTLLIFISDNGGPTKKTSSKNGPLRGYKGEVFEGGFRVPFIAQWKGHIPAGKTYEQPVIALDLLPTFLAAAGTQAPDDVQFDGVNLLPFLAGESDAAPHEYLYWRYGKQSAVRKGDWKLVQREQEGEQLYDLKSDIGEKQNLAMQQPEILNDLKQAYAKWNAELVEPLWPRAGQPTK